MPLSKVLQSIAKIHISNMKRHVSTRGKRIRLRGPQNKTIHVCKFLKINWKFAVREHSVSGVSWLQQLCKRLQWGGGDEGWGGYFEGRARQDCRPTTVLKTYSPGPLELNVDTPVIPIAEYTSINAIPCMNCPQLYQCFSSSMGVSYHLVTYKHSMWEKH